MCDLKTKAPRILKAWKVLQKLHLEGNVRYTHSKKCLMFGMCLRSASICMSHLVFQIIHWYV